jgi:hypothetical protein
MIIDGTSFSLCITIADGLLILVLCFVYLKQIKGLYIA